MRTADVGHNERLPVYVVVKLSTLSCMSSWRNRRPGLWSAFPGCLHKGSLGKIVGRLVCGDVSPAPRPFPNRASVAHLLPDFKLYNGNGFSDHGFGMIPFAAIWISAVGSEMSIAWNCQDKSFAKHFPIRAAKANPSREQAELVRLMHAHACSSCETRKS